MTADGRNLSMFPDLTDKPVLNRDNDDTWQDEIAGTIFDVWQVISCPSQYSGF
jgi:hypothetical protein